LYGHEGGGWVVEVEFVAVVDEGVVVASIWGHVQMLDVWVLVLAVIVADRDVWVEDILPWCGYYIGAIYRL